MHGGMQGGTMSSLRHASPTCPSLLQNERALAIWARVTHGVFGQFPSVPIRSPFPANNTGPVATCLWCTRGGNPCRYTALANQTKCLKKTVCKPGTIVHADFQGFTATADRKCLLCNSPTYVHDTSCVEPPWQWYIRPPTYRQSPASCILVA